MPSKIVLPIQISDKNLLQSCLSKICDKDVQIVCYKSGKIQKLLNLTTQNAKISLENSIKERDDIQNILLELKNFLNLERVPERIEGFDISNLYGKHSVGSCVVFEDGKFNKSEYRHFKIKTIEGIDDYEMIKEIIKRRYKKSLQDTRLPDLILIDGGKGHITTALSCLRELGLDNVSLISLAKDEEEIFKVDNDEPIILPHNSKLLHLLQNIRDEAHRFAINYYKKLHLKEMRKLK